MAFPIRGPWQFDTPGRRLALALAISLLVHGVLYTSWKLSPAVALFTHKVIQRVFPQVAKAIETRNAKAAEKLKPLAEVPMVFVEVDPAMAAAEPPRETKNYSTVNSVAANPQPAQHDVPKLDGTQTRMLRMADNPRPKPQPLQPTPPKPQDQPKPEEQPEVKPKPAPKIGDLAMTKTEQRPVMSDGDATAAEPKHTKPRTLREAMQRNPALAGQKTLQEGGVQHAHLVPSIDAKASPFGDYDYAFIRAVEQRWFQLLEENNQYLYDRQGKVILNFKLHFDGRITDVEVESNSVGEILALLCEKAIVDPAPFPRWPTPMRQAVKLDYREVRFTFYYD